MDQAQHNKLHMSLPELKSSKTPEQGENVINLVHAGALFIPHSESGATALGGNM